jgi:tetraacyldisaccharide 4'-kinase
MPCRPNLFDDQRPVFHTRHTPVIRKIKPGGGTFLTETKDLTQLKGKNALAFAGLAENQQFFESLRVSGCKLAETVSFTDHHSYDQSDIEHLIQTAVEKNVDLVVTSLKDCVKLDANVQWPFELIVVDVCIEFLNDEKRFSDFLAAALDLPGNNVYKKI